MSEQDYINGSRSAYIHMLAICCRELGINDPEAQKVSWIIEREETIQKLRSLCDALGDNDWEPTLHLADIIEKHLIILKNTW